MKQKDMVITNAVLVLPGKIIKGSLVVLGGKIERIVPGEEPVPSSYAALERVDAEGMYVMPGLIELHSDAIEKEIQPRPGSLFPLDMAMASLEKKMAGYGVTTLYHSISSSDGTAVRNDETVGHIIRFAARKRDELSMIRHRIHYRYEITNLSGIRQVDDLLDGGQIDLLSFMDHTPGQGQYASRDTYRDYLIGTEHISGEAADQLLDELVRLQQGIDWPEVERLAAKALAQGVQIASHDDDTAEKVDAMRRLGVRISEFPVNLDAAKHAKEAGLFVSVGAPNIIRGGSHNRNMRAIDAVSAGSVHILCSDYYPASLLPSVFIIAEKTGDLPEAVRMVTLNPAEAVGVASKLGSLAEGKTADLIFVEKAVGQFPVVRKTYVGGVLVQEANFCAKEQVEMQVS